MDKDKEIENPYRLIGFGNQERITQKEENLYQPQEGCPPPVYIDPFIPKDDQIKCCKYLPGIIGMKILVLLWILDLVVQLFEEYNDGLTLNLFATILGTAFILVDNLKTRKALRAAICVKIFVDCYIVVKYFWLLGESGYNMHY